MKKTIILGLAMVMCTTAAMAQRSKECVVYQCNNGYYAGGYTYDYISDQAMYTTCTKCPSVTLASGGTATVRTWTYSSSGYVEPKAPLLQSACYIAASDSQKFKDSTGHTYKYAGNCAY